MNNNNINILNPIINSNFMNINQIQNIQNEKTSIFFLEIQKFVKLLWNVNWMIKFMMLLKNIELRQMTEIWMKNSYLMQKI